MASLSSTAATPRPLWIVGAGGHAKVVIETARAMGAFLPVGVLDDDPGKIGAEVLGVPIRGGISLADVTRLGIEDAVIAIGNNRVRTQLAVMLVPFVRWATLVHPSAVVAPSVRLGEGTVVFANAVIQPDSVIGRHVIVNTGASIDHDCRIGHAAHVAPGVRLAGNVSVGEGAFLGIGSCAIPGCRIGDWATVGAGGVVIDEIPAGGIAKGIPARVTLRGEQG